jgi:Ca2+-binding RTX toxin-like protein
MVAVRPRFGAFAALLLALTVAVLLPARAAAFAEFSNGVLTVHASEGKIVPRCAADGELTVSGAGMDDGRPTFCRELKRIEATSIVQGLFDFSQLPDNLGGGQGPIEIHASSEITDTTEISEDKFIGAPGHINIFEGGLGSDSITGGNLNDQLSGGDEFDKIEGGSGDDTILGGAEGDKLNGGDGNDTLSGGADGDKIEGGAGSDTLKGGAGGDKLIGGLGGDRLFGGGAKDKLEGGPGRDFLNGGGGADKLIGGPGKDKEKQ